MGEGVVLAINLVESLISHAADVTALIKTAQSQGRDVTAAELDSLVSADNQARTDLIAAIAQRKVAEDAAKTT